MLGHSVERRCEAAGEKESAFREQTTAWAILERYYVPTRYPNSLPGSIPAHVYNRDVARDAVGLARDVVAFVAARMGMGETGR